MRYNINTEEVIVEEEGDETQQSQRGAGSPTNIVFESPFRVQSKKNIIGNFEKHIVKRGENAKKKTSQLLAKRKSNGDIAVDNMAYSKAKKEFLLQVASSKSTNNSFEKKRASFQE